MLMQRSEGAKSQWHMNCVRMRFSLPAHSLSMQPVPHIAARLRQFLYAMLAARFIELAPRATSHAKRE